MSLTIFSGVSLSLSINYNQGNVVMDSILVVAVNVNPIPDGLQN